MAYIVVGILLVISALFIFRQRLVKILDALIKVFFVLFLAVALAGILTPATFENAVDSGLRNAGTHGLIIEIDEGLSQVQNLPENIFEGIGSLFGGGNQQEGPEAEQVMEEGFLERTLYTGLVLGISGIVRAIAIIGSIVGLIVLTYVQYSVGGAADLAKMEKRVRELEDRIAEMQVDQIAPN